MSRLLRRTIALASTAFAAGALILGGAGSASSTQPLLPNLTLAQVLEIADVAAPPAGTGLLIHADFPVENPLVVDGVAYTAFSADILPTGGMQVKSAVPATSQATSGTAASTEVGECDDPFFTPTGYTWDSASMPIEWRYNRLSTPENVGQWRAQGEMRTAHSIWTKVNSKCRNADRVSFAYRFGGNSGRRVGFDEHNVVTFANIDDGALALNYTWYVGRTVKEVDIAFNKHDYRWTAKLGGNHRYQIVNVATHELGHQLGLDDLNDPHGQLTMFGRINKGEMKKLSLGLGDVRGAETVSP